MTLLDSAATIALQPDLIAIDYRGRDRFDDLDRLGLRIEEPEESV